MENFLITMIDTMSYTVRLQTVKIIFSNSTVFVSGPLLYHFSDLANESSIELSYEEVRNIIKRFNFDIVVSTFVNEDEMHSLPTINLVSHDKLLY